MSRNNRFDDGDRRAEGPISNRDGPSRGESDSNWRKGGGGGSRDDSRGGGGGYRDRGSRMGDDRAGGGGNWRSGGAGGGPRFGGSSSSSGQRPRLNLKPRGSGASMSESTENKLPATVEADKQEATDESKTRREPPVVNSRAAAFGSAPEVQQQSLRSRESRGDRGVGQNRGPPPVTNQRMAQLADEERDRKDREMRGPSGPVNSSRFAQPSGDDRRSTRESQGPPPVANSRFAAAAAMAKQEGGAEERDKERFDRGGRGGRYGDRDRDRDGPGGRGGERYSDRGPPPPQNSRFAAAAAADSDYGGRDGGDDRGPPRGGDRFGGRDRDDRFGGGGRGYGRDRDDRGYGDRPGPGRYNDRPGGRGGFGGSRDYGDLPRGPKNSLDDLPRGPRSTMGPDAGPPPSLVDEILKPKPRVDSDNTLLAASKPSPEHEANILQFAGKARKKDEDEDFLVLGKGTPKQKTQEPEPETAAPAPPAVDEEKSKELLAEFVSGNKMGGDLKEWTVENRGSLPSVDQLVFHLLMEREKLNPDPECAWAEPKNFGSALQALVGDDIVGQMQVLWGIQFYCEKIGFPKFENEYIVQAMFRAMYKYDLAEDDAFTEWKDDETEAFEKGKLKAIIQTVEWFNWLAEADAEEEDDEEAEEEEEEAQE